MDEERIERQISRTFRPYSSLPEEADFDMDRYLEHLVDNLRGPLRQFRSRVLDLGNLMCTDELQRRVYRDFVFQAEQEMTRKLDEWCAFYELDSTRVQEAIRDEHTQRSP